MKTYWQNQKTGERINIEFNRTKMICEIGTLHLFWAYEKAKRKPHGIYGYFYDINKNHLCMLVKEFVGKITMQEMEDQCIKRTKEFQSHQIKKIREYYQEFLNAY